MRFVVFGGEKRLGAVHDERVLDLRGAAVAAGWEPEPFTSLLALIEAGDRGLDGARQLTERFAESEQPGVCVDLARARLHAPFPGRRFALGGSNNADHVANAFRNRDRDITADQVRADTRKGPAGGFWVVDPPAGPDAEVEIPRSAHGLFDYEGEVAIILAGGGKRVPADIWPGKVWGTTLVIDWSVRGQTIEGTRRPFYAHKIFDNSKSLGPWISVGEVDPLDCQVETRINGELRQKFNSGDMIYTYGELLEQISEDVTLLPGDVLAGGTGAGTAMDSTRPKENGELPLGRFLKAGDHVEVSSPGLGTLAATVIAAT